MMTIIINKNKKIDRVFAKATDFEISDAVCSAIEELYGYDTIQARSPNIPHDRWVVYTVFSNTGFFENNGYSYFWGTAIDHSGFAENLKEVGLPILSSVIFTAIKKVPQNKLGNWDAVDTFFGSYENRLEAANNMDEKLINENPNIIEKVSKYVRKHRYNYIDLIKKIENCINETRLMFEEYEH